MSNITITVNDDLLRKARKVAVEKDTTLTAMIRRFLVTVAQSEESKKNSSISHLRASFNRLSRDMGRRKWKREELYDR